MLSYGDWISAGAVKEWWEGGAPHRPYSAVATTWAHFLGDSEPRQFYVYDTRRPYEYIANAAQKAGCGFIPVNGLLHPLPIPKELRDLSEILGVAMVPQTIPQCPTTAIPTKESADDIPF